MPDLLHTDAVQQLEVALLGSPAAQVFDLLSGGLMQTKPSTFAAPAQPCPHTYTSTPLAPPPTSVLVVGVSTSSQIPIVVVPAMESTCGVNKLAPLKAKISKFPMIPNVITLLPLHSVHCLPVQCLSLL